MQNNESMPKYCGIRKCAQLGIFPEAALRRMLKAGKLPGIYSGEKFIVNVPALEKLLDQMSERGERI